MSRVELQALGKRLREARDRSRRIASQQQREMRGKADPRGAASARDNTGSLSKTAVLVGALTRVTAALRNPRQSGHRFRRKAVIQSDRKRPPIPIEGGHRLLIG
jgi:hypothetical protein